MMNTPHKKNHKARDKLIRQPLPERTFEEAVSAVLSAPPTPEQQTKKAAAKERREQRKRQQQANTSKQDNRER